MNLVLNFMSSIVFFFIMTSSMVDILLLQEVSYLSSPTSTIKPVI